MKKVTVYTKFGCPQCDMTKTMLIGEGVEFNTINIEKDEAAYDHVINTLGLRQMPVVVVEGQDPFSGFRPDLLLTL
ncbi:glutaredoxin domain-containing protein [Rossellomorea marisflavi]|uniref:glutaredoxin domain-containing protein n=1 Tax=Rossellomorea marisflavi TaxID=189381 RepID=UPI003F9FE2FD